MQSIMLQTQLTAGKGTKPEKKPGQGAENCRTDYKNKNNKKK